MIEEIFNCWNQRKIKRVWDKEASGLELTDQDVQDYYDAKFTIRCYQGKKVSDPVKLDRILGQIKNSFSASLGYFNKKDSFFVYLVECDEDLTSDKPVCSNND
jgi:hypothetical protein